MVIFINRGALFSQDSMFPITFFTVYWKSSLTGPGVRLISIGDFLTGVSDSTMGILMDALYETWNLDPAHGERLAYTKIGLALLKHIDKKRQVGGNQPAKGVVRASVPMRAATRGAAAEPSVIPMRGTTALPPLLLQETGETPPASPSSPIGLILTAAGAAPRAATAAAAATPGKGRVTCGGVRYRLKKM